MDHLSPNTRGAFFMMLAMAGYVLNDAGMKYVSGDLNLFQAILIRGCFASVLMWFVAWRMGALNLPDGFLPTLSHPAVWLRAMFEVGGTFFFLNALFHMPLGNVTAVLQLLPLTMTLGAALLFGEQVGWRRYTAIIVGFLGVLLIIRPGTDGFNIYALSALAATGFVTLRDLITRRLPSTTPSLFVSLITPNAITLFGAVGAAFEPWNATTGQHYVVLAASASILMMGYVCSILAMREGDVSFVSPFRYSILIWALVIGYVLFSEVPDGWALLGAAIVVGSGLFTFYRERRALRSVPVR